jgi:type II secretory ATPase GspE/PulE/Tfp pilus assembly ATPase PilB-like protein
MAVPAPLRDYAYLSSTGSLFVATDAPLHVSDDITRFIQGQQIALTPPRIKPATSDAIKQMIESSNYDEGTDEEDDGEGSVDEAKKVLEATKGRRVSDVHINIDHTGVCFIDFEIDGRLHEYARCSANDGIRLIHGFWTMVARNGGHYSHSLMSQSPFPRATYGGELLAKHLFNIRTQFMKTVGYAFVARLTHLTGDGEIQTLDQLNYATAIVPILRAVARMGYGGVLVTGEIGHGKTMLLYALAYADYLYRVSLGIRGAFYSFEQPPERLVWWMRQIPINDDEDWAEAFKAALRGALKVGFAGELRSLVEIKIWAKMALIFKAYATFHAADVISAFVRMREEGVPDHLLRDPKAFAVVISQRLIPILCPHCSVKWAASPDCETHELTPTLRQFGLFDKARRKGQERTASCADNGCDEGFIGRRPVLEILHHNEELIDTILKSAGEGRRRWLCEGGVSMGMQALDLIRAGETDPEYVDMTLPIKAAMADAAIVNASAAPVLEAAE